MKTTRITTAMKTITIPATLALRITMRGVVVVAAAAVVVLVVLAVVVIRKTGVQIKLNSNDTDKHEQVPAAL